MMRRVALCHDHVQVEVASVVVFTCRPDETVAFYRALGVPLEDEDHGDGRLHRAGDAGGVHVAVIPAHETTHEAAHEPSHETTHETTHETPAHETAPGWRAAGSTFVGWW